MQKSTKAKIVGGATAIVMACGLAVAGSSLTSAYFSDTNTGGAITATYGSIFVDVDGEKKTTTDIDLTDILPGEARTGTFTATNSGKSAQDVYVSFPNAIEVQAINSLGRSAAIEIKVDGEQVFFSDNLNANYPGTLIPLPEQLLLKSDLPAGESINVEFSFTYAAHNTSQLVTIIPMTLHYDVVATQVGIAPGA